MRRAVMALRTHLDLAVFVQEILSGLNRVSTSGHHISPAHLIGSLVYYILYPL